MGADAHQSIENMKEEVVAASPPPQRHVKEEVVPLRKRLCDSLLGSLEKQFVYGSLSCRNDELLPRFDVGLWNRI